VRGLLENKVYDPKSLVQVIKFQLLIYEQVVKIGKFYMSVPDLVQLHQTVSEISY